MRKWIKISLCLLGLCVLGGGLVWVGIRSRVEGKSQGGRSEEDIFPHVKINNRARAIVGADESAIRELVDAVFQTYMLHGVPEGFLRPFKERLIRSEVSYRSGRSAGISEDSIVRLLDLLADKFSAPEYARSSQDEVREYRLGMAQLLPDFIVRRPLEKGTPPDHELNFTVNPLLSPVEAAYIVGNLIQQKEHSEYYLLTPQERSVLKSNVNKALQRLDDKGIQLSPQARAEVKATLFHQELYKQSPQRTPEEIAVVAETRSANQAGQGRSFILMSSGRNPRQKEMAAVMQRAMATPIGEALELAHSLLDLLRIER